MKVLVITASVESALRSAPAGEGGRVCRAFVSLEERKKREGVFLLKRRSMDEAFE